MICVTDIKLVYVPDNRAQFYYANQHNPNIYNFTKVLDSNPPEYVEVTEELITGRKFINARGERVNIGMSKDVQDAIGLPFAAYENMRNSISNLNGNIDYEKNMRRATYSKLEAYMNMPILARIKFLFTGRFEYGNE